MEPLEEVVLVCSYTAGSRSSGLVESELHVIRDMIKLPEHVQLSGSHLRGVPIHLRPREWPSGIFSSMDWVSALLSCTMPASVSPLCMYFYMAGPGRLR